jgi:hypothetical protein
MLVQNAKAWSFFENLTGFGRFQHLFFQGYVSQTLVISKDKYPNAPFIILVLFFLSIFAMTMNQIRTTGFSSMTNTRKKQLMCNNFETFFCPSARLFSSSMENTHPDFTPLGASRYIGNVQLRYRLNNTEGG